MLLLADAKWPTSVVMAVLVLTIALLLMRSRRYFAKPPGAWDSRGGGPAARQTPAESNPADPEEMVRWEVHMHEVARDLSARLDSKMSLLGHLVQEADRAAARLEAALEAVGRRNAAPAESCPARPGSTSEISAKAGQAPKPSHQAEALAGVVGQAPGDAKRSQRYEEIYTLADYGYPCPEIARRLNLPVGEVELILNLRAKGDRS
jgi:hypothetical protein